MRPLSLGAQTDSELRIRPIHDFERVLCASPDYVARYGMPGNGDELFLNHHKCLMLRFPGAVEFYLDFAGGTYAKALPVRSAAGER